MACYLVLERVVIGFGQASRGSLRSVTSTAVAGGGAYGICGMLAMALGPAREAPYVPLA